MLEELAQRLFFILVQVVVSIGTVIFAIVVSSHSKGAVPEWWPYLTSGTSTALAVILAFLLFRLIQMAYGDIGFLKLQRRILSNAVNRERKKEATKRVEASVTYRTPGAFGEALQSRAKNQE
ncbi:MAG: hypothetical protein K2X11_08220 [Acetobacteraceae bacterium]|nr:hypothetical protein [Acetobacteraceae bacterium]